MSNTIKNAQPNSYIFTINTKMAEISRKMSCNITFVDQVKINDIMDKVTDFKTSISTLKNKITNFEDLADSCFENVLNQLESCYQFIMTNVIEVHSGSSRSGGTACRLDTSEIEYLKLLFLAIPSFPDTLSNANWTSTYNAAAKIPSALSSSDLATLKTNSAKAAAVHEALRNTLSNSNWTNTYNAVSSITTGFAVD
jgi:hypothetical protein